MIDFLECVAAVHLTIRGKVNDRLKWSFAVYGRDKDQENWIRMKKGRETLGAMTHSKKTEGALNEKSIWKRNG